LLNVLTVESVWLGFLLPPLFLHTLWLAVETLPHIRVGSHMRTKPLTRL
jgi:hypothetical protein